MSNREDPHRQCAEGPALQHPPGQGSKADLAEAFRLFFEQSADPMWLLDPRAGVFVSCNDAATRLLQARTREELLGVRPSDLSPPLQPNGRSSAECQAEIIARVEAEGSHRFEWMGRRFDGALVPMEVAMTRLQVDGRVLHAVVSRDISRRKGQEQALRDNQRLLTSIADNLREAIYRTGPRHELVFANAAYLRLFGYDSFAELAALPRERLYANPADRAQLLEGLARDGKFNDVEIEFIRRDGSRFWGLINSVAIRDPDRGSIAYHIGSILDITERKQAHDEIRQLNAGLERRVAERTAELAASEERLRTLVEHAPEAIVLFDGDTGRFVTVNENAVRLYGLSREALLQVGPWHVSPPFQPDGRPSADAARERIQQALAGEQPAFEWTHRHASGRLVPCEVRLVRLPSDGKRLVRGSVLDNTERHRRERVQQATFAISQSVLEAQDLATLYARIHTIIRGLLPVQNFYIALWDQATEMITFPYFVDEFVASPEPLRITTGLTGEVLRTGKPLLVTRSMQDRKRPIGNAVVIEGVTDLPYVESGPPAAVWLGVPLRVQERILGVMAVQDYANESAFGPEDQQVLTFVAGQIALAIERKRSEEALLQRHREVVTLLDSLPGYAFLKGTDGRYVMANRNFGRAVGAVSHSIGGKTDYDLFPPDLAAKYAADDAKLLASGQTIVVGEEQMIDEGRVVYVQTTKVLVKSEQGEPVRLIGLGFDISERKRVQEEMLVALAREKELSQLKSDFVSIVSHEFRTPLGIIQSSAEILNDYLDQLDPQDRREHLASIVKNTRRMAGLMEEVLVLGRIEAGKMSFEPAVLNLPVLCARITEDVRSSSRNRCPIDLRVRELPPEASVDEGLIRHILTNVLSNAVKYSEEGSTVDFTGHQEGADAVFVIRDRGIGISEADQKYLFQAFHRGGNVGQRPGSGLGLVIVKRCVELHRGTIEVQSRAGEGTVVTVRLRAF